MPYGFTYKGLKGQCTFDCSVKETNIDERDTFALVLLEDTDTSRGLNLYGLILCRTEHDTYDSYYRVGLFEINSAKYSHKQVSARLAFQSPTRVKIF